MALRILVVTDGAWTDRVAGSYTENDPTAFGAFGLGIFLRSLQTAIAGAQSPEITRAHRSPSVFFHYADDMNDHQAIQKGFRFDDQSLDAIDELWLFGVEDRESMPGTADPPYTPLDDREIANIWKFMQRGGGVFATGDHEDLGWSLCGRIPRVASMRSWWSPDATPYGQEPDSAAVAPPGYTVAPSFSGPKRHDTLQFGSPDPPDLTVWPFEWQEDAIAQPIKAITAFSGPRSRLHVHPVLSGLEGPPAFLPDHPHEGRCHAPLDPTRQVTVDGTVFNEYPSTGRGVQILPEVIATADVLGGHSTQPPVKMPQGIFQGNKPPTTALTFGVMSAYDGQAVGRGRVFCDSTWHHYFNVNLAGLKSADDAPWEGLQKYYRQILIWLAPQRVRFWLIGDVMYFLKHGPYAEMLASYSRYDILDPRLRFDAGSEALGMGFDDLPGPLILDAMTSVLPLELHQRLVELEAELGDSLPWTTEDLATIALGAGILAVAKSDLEVDHEAGQFVDPEGVAAVVSAAGAAAIHDVVGSLLDSMDGVVNHVRERWTFESDDARPS